MVGRKDRGRGEALIRDQGEGGTSGNDRLWEDKGRNVLLGEERPREGGVLDGEERLAAEIEMRRGVSF